MKKVRITQLAVDWREDFRGKDITKAMKLVGGKQLFIDCPQDGVDCKVVFISSVDLSYEQIRELWEVGDLWSECEYIDGNTYKEALKQLKLFADIDVQLNKVEEIPYHFKERKVEAAKLECMRKEFASKLHFYKG